MNRHRSPRISRALVFAVATGFLSFGSMASGQPDSKTVFNPVSGSYFKLEEAYWCIGCDWPYSWYQARSSAEEAEFNGMTGHLATFVSAEEENVVISAFPEIKPNYVWLGASDEASEGDWRWLTDESWGYANWDNGEPNGGAFENCLQYSDLSTRWNDAACSNKYEYYLVEFPMASDPLNGLVTFVPDPSTYSFTPGAGRDEQLVFSDDFEDGFPEWTTGSDCVEDTIEIVGGRVQSTDHCNYIESIRQFDGNLRIELDIEKAGDKTNTGVFSIELRSIAESAGIIGFYSDADIVRVGDVDEVFIDRSEPKRGKAIFTYENLFVTFQFISSNGIVFDAGRVYAGPLELTTLRIYLQGTQDSPLYVDNVKVYETGQACPAGSIGRFSFDAALSNMSENGLKHMSVRVNELSNGNLLLSEYGLLEAGQAFPLMRTEDYTNGLLGPDERVDIPFTICLRSKSRFRFFVDVLGQVAQTQGGFRIQTHIDGRSRLILVGSYAYWHHLDFAAPGRHEFMNGPTIIDGVSWFPVWPDLPDAENRDCNCSSDIDPVLSTDLPKDAMFELDLIKGRGQTRIVEHPSWKNDYKLIIEFDDNMYVGSDDYIVDVHLY